MRNLNLIHIPSNVSAFWHDFPDWINQHRSTDGERIYRALEPDALADNRLNLAVEISGRDGCIATSKFNIIEICGPREAWFVFSSLVVQWEQGGAGHRPETGKAIVQHVVLAVQNFRRTRRIWSHNILIASGNLTVAKGGKPFFERLGWQIVCPETREPDHVLCGEADLAEPLEAVAGEIEAAIAPLRLAGKIQPEPICFAILRLT